MSLFQQLFTEAKVYLVPGSMFGCNIPGWFRIIFAVTPERWEECIFTESALLGWFSHRVDMSVCVCAPVFFEASN